VLDRSELDRLLDHPPVSAVADDAVRARDDAVLELLYGCGLRVSELCGLDVGDVDRRKRTVTVVGKGNRQRRVPMHDHCVEIVEQWLRRGRPELLSPDSPPQALFLNARGRRLGPRDVRRLLDRRAPSPTHPHALRHSFATHLLEQDVDIRVIQVLLGHAKLDTTALYARVATKTIRAVTGPLERLALLMEGQSTTG
jgi:site-specific recombinase XerD